MPHIQENNANLIQKFIAYRESQGKSEYTIKNNRYSLQQFSAKVKKTFYEVTQDDILMFVGEKSLSPHTLSIRYVTLNVFYRWTLRENLMLISPMKNIPSPRITKALPKKIMTIGETQKVLNVYSTQSEDSFEFRNRVILELMYSCSLRRKELVELKLSSFDPIRKSLVVTSSKTQKERIVPVGRVASELLQTYIKTKRINNCTNYLFTGKKKKSLGPDLPSRIARQARKLSGIRTKATSHSFRKSSATHMLRNGASMSSVQELLGHTKLKSTEAYTKVYPKDLVKMHRAHHPREKQKNYKLPDLKTPTFLESNYKLFRPINGVKPVLLNDLSLMQKDYHPREIDGLPELKTPKFIDGNGHFFIRYVT